jgi:Fe-S cluster biogenesis protein NfuA
MEEVAGRWKSTAIEAGGNSDFPTRTEEDDEAKRKQMLIELIEATADYDDDDDDEFEDINGFAREDNLNIIGLDVPPRTPIPIDAQDEDVVSPFSVSDTSRAEDAQEGEKLEFNIETVDKILDEIRPYLIQDGGNVSVQSVDVEQKNVYLVLEGACGSCPSSTVTMQMGIQRVLKENFDDLGDVIQVEDQAKEDSKPTELTMEAVLEEVSRISPAITAMGGVVEILSVDPIGVVEVRFRGANKVQQGLELALRDVPFVKHVKFVI